MPWKVDVTTALESLEGQLIASVCVIHDYVQLRFSSGAILSLLNAFEVRGPAAGAIDGLVARRLVTASESELSVTLEFDDGSVIAVGMTPESWRGPEALTLHAPGQALVVWNRRGRAQPIRCRAQREFSEAKRLKSGDAVTATVQRVERFGVFLEHEGEQILVLVPELSWQPLPDPAQRFAVGDQVQVRILRHVPEHRQFIGSIRVLSMEDSPYAHLAAALPGTRFAGQVQGMFGGNVSIIVTEPRALGYASAERAPAGLKAGDLVEVVVKSVDVESSEVELEVVASTA